MLLERFRSLLAHPLRGRVTKFAIASAIAAGTSAVVFPVLYVLGLSTTACTIIAFFAGAIPNWTLNRRWTWKVEGRVAFGREILAYLVISGSTLAVLSLATGLTDHAVQHIPAHHGIRVILVTGSYFGMLAVLYGVRFFLYEHWIFSGRSRVRAALRTRHAALRSRRQVWNAARANRTP
ncbi:MAG TPA: GtrA family protein [Solirubrobacteraceae bacterium]|nr:GtrA family protein [Solirubrobacteraceae bacterium]